MSFLPVFPPPIQTQAVPSSVPDLETLWLEAQAGDSKPKDKAAFMAAANELLEAMTKQKPVRLMKWGKPYFSGQVDPEFGIPADFDNAGDDFSRPGSKQEGRTAYARIQDKSLAQIAVLRWFAARGSYPVNSTKRKK